MDPLNTFPDSIDLALREARFSEAIRLTDGILAEDPKNAAAWEKRGLAAAAMQNEGDAVNAWICALRAAPPDERPQMEARVAPAAGALLTGTLQSRADAYAGAPSPQTFSALIRAPGDCLSRMNDLTAQTALPMAAGALGTRFARILYEAAVAAFAAAGQGYGPAHSSMQRWQWETYTETADDCLELLQSAAALCRENDLGKSICDRYVLIAEQVAASCAWKYAGKGAGEDGYEPERTFTEHAKRLRRESMRAMRVIRGYFEADQIGRLSADLAAARADEDARRGAAVYWAAHGEEKRQLEAERKRLRTAAQTALGQLQTLNTDPQAPARRQTRERLQAELSALGPFRGKEKKALRQKLEAFSVLEAEREEKRAAQRKKLEWTVKKSRARIAEINRIFSAPHPPAPQPAGSGTIENALRNGRLSADAETLAARLARLLPDTVFPEAVCPIGGAPVSPPEAFRFSGGGLFCRFGKKNAPPAGDAAMPVLFFLNADAGAPPDGLLLQGPAAYAAGEEALHDFALVASGILLLLSGEPDRPAAERAVLTLRHGKTGAPVDFGDLRLSFGFARQTLPDGRTVQTEHICFLPVSGRRST